MYSDSERSTLTDRAWAIVGWVQPDFFYMRKNKLQYCLNHSEFCQHLQLMNIGNNDFWLKRREGKSSGCLWEKFLCSQKEVPERNSWAHEGWLELHSGILWLEGSHLGTQQRWWGCWIWRWKEGPWRRCWVSELINSGVTISHSYVKYCVWSIQKCTFGHIVTLLKSVCTLLSAPP